MVNIVVRQKLQNNRIENTQCEPKKSRDMSHIETTNFQRFKKVIFLAKP